MEPHAILSLNAPNGEQLTAPTGVWLLAMYDLMPDGERTKLFERVKKMRDDAMDQNIIIPNAMQTNNIIQLNTTRKKDESMYIDKNGKRHITMYCESGKYDSSLIKAAAAARGRKERMRG